METTRHADDPACNRVVVEPTGAITKPTDRQPRESARSKRGRLADRLRREEIARAAYEEVIRLTDEVRAIRERLDLLGGDEARRRELAQYQRLVRKEEDDARREGEAARREEEAERREEELVRQEEEAERREEELVRQEEEATRREEEELALLKEETARREREEDARWERKAMRLAKEFGRTLDLDRAASGRSMDDKWHAVVVGAVRALRGVQGSKSFQRCIALQRAFNHVAIEAGVETGAERITVRGTNRGTLNRDGKQWDTTTINATRIVLRVAGYSKPWHLVWSPWTTIWVSDATKRGSNALERTLRREVLKSLRTDVDDEPATVLETVGRNVLDDRCAADCQTIYVVTTTDVFRINGKRLESGTGAMAVVCDEAWVV